MIKLWDNLLIPGAFNLMILATPQDLRNVGIVVVAEAQAVAY